MSASIAVRPQRRTAAPRRRFALRLSPLAISALIHGAGLVWLASMLAAAPPPDPAATVFVEAAAEVPDLEETPEFIEPELPPVERPEQEPEQEVLEEVDVEWIEDQIDTPSDPDPSPFAARVTIGLGGSRRRPRAGRGAAQAPPAEVDSRPVTRPAPPVAVPVEPDRPPVSLASNAAPSYPRLARTRGWAGVVRLRIEVDSEGTVVRTTVAQSSGYPVLDRAALDAAAKWRFEPATRDGRPASGVVLQTVRFVL